MEQKGIAQSGVLNQNDVVKKIARKREGLDDSIDSIWVEEFPIKPKPNEDPDWSSPTNIEPFGNVKISPKKDEIMLE